MPVDGGALPSARTGSATLTPPAALRPSLGATATPRPADSGSPLDETLRRSAIMRRSLAVADLLAGMVALALAAALSDHGLRLGLLPTAIVVVVAAKLSRLYDRDEARLRKSTLEELPALFQLTAVSVLLLWLSGAWLLEGQLGREELVTLWLALLATIVAGRIVARWAVARLLPLERCLIVGDLSAAGTLAETIAGRRAEIVGLVPFADRRRRPRDGCPAPWADLDAVARRSRAHRIIVVPGVGGDTDATLSCVSQAQEMGAAVSILPHIGEVVGSSIEFDHVDGLILFGVHRFGLSRSSRLIKRAIDVCGAAVGLLAVAPLMLAIAIAIRLESAGPVLFRQPRVGYMGEPFEMLKFRSMYDGAHERRAELAAFSQAGEGMFKVAGDPRVTRVGRVIRRFSLDEMPQLLNVLRGDMSLVGPRPLVLDEDRRIAGHHRRRLQLTPGITGPWQVLGTAERRVPLRDMVTIDYLYAGNWSVWTDVKILLRTVMHVVRGSGL